MLITQGSVVRVHSGPPGSINNCARNHLAIARGGSMNSANWLFSGSVRPAMSRAVLCLANSITRWMVAAGPSDSGAAASDHHALGLSSASAGWVAP